MWSWSWVSSNLPCFWLVLSPIIMKWNPMFVLLSGRLRPQQLQEVRSRLPRVGSASVREKRVITSFYRFPNDSPVPRRLSARAYPNSKGNFGYKNIDADKFQEVLWRCDELSVVIGVGSPGGAFRQPPKPRWGSPLLGGQSDSKRLKLDFEDDVAKDLLKYLGTGRPVLYHELLNSETNWFWPKNG